MPRCDKHSRTELIFNLIIEQYLACGTPVSSKFIAQEGAIEASPATVRNDMCMLEKSGMIYSPHTSAGRIPTNRGLRHFVDGILSCTESKHNGLQKLSASLGQADNAEAIGEKAAKLIADMTSLTGLVVMPKVNNVVIRQLELVPLADRRLLCVLIDEHDHIQNRVVELDEPVSEAVLQQTLQLLNTALSGFSMSEGAERLPYFIKQSDPEVYALVKKALFGEQVVANEQDVFTSEAIRLVHPEISSDTKVLKQIVRSFGDLTALMPMLQSCQLEDEVKVFIGEEINNELFDKCSLVVKPFCNKGEFAGYVAVIGPVRMDYASVITAVDITANIVSSALNRQ
jgi:heat-inducible transcriptional repressor